MSTAFPGHREVDVVLRDGSTACLRPVRPTDEDALLRLFNDLDPASQAFRFFSGAVDSHRIALAGAERAVAADARIRIASPAPRRPWPATWS